VRGDGLLGCEETKLCEHRVEYEIGRVTYGSMAPRRRPDVPAYRKEICISQCSRPRKLPSAIIAKSVTDPARMERRFNGASPCGARECLGYQCVPEMTPQQLAELFQ
jgi:hypothetical protein